MTKCFMLKFLRNWIKKQENGPRAQTSEPSISRVQGSPAWTYYDLGSSSHLVHGPPGPTPENLKFSFI
jgi:hypothetical protein